jgi:hypothetical protein
LPNFKTIARLLLLTLGALAIHGYHPYAEDAEIYLPGVEKLLHPELFPFHVEFFQTQGNLTLFSRLMASSVRLSHLPFDYALFLWHLFSIFMLLLASWKLGARFFSSESARWGAVTLTAALLTLPLAGTALYVMDQYLNPRNLAAFAGLFGVLNVIDGRLVRAAIWLIFAVFIHPLMAWFALSFCLLWLVFSRLEARPTSTTTAAAPAFLLFLPKIFYPASTGYHEAIRFHENHYILRWQWYEWLGAIAPILIFWLLERLARKRGMVLAACACRVLTFYGIVYFVAALVISIPQRFEALARLQPLRSLHLLYMLLIIIGGGFLAEYVLKNRVWRWLVLFVPLCAGMFLAQRSLFPASDHVEWPWAKPKNLWEQAFIWIRNSTPSDAIFAIDPVYIELPGEDTAAFRPLAERSSIADGYKDSGTVSMFPPLADLWWEQFQAERNWTTFTLADFVRLRDRYDVNWVVLQSPGITGLECPYQNRAVMVCRVAR